MSSDARVRNLVWKDLADLNTSERIRELALPLPSLAVALMAAAYGLWIVALPASFYFFLSGLRLVHDTFHGNLGLRRWGNDAVLLVLSTLMLGSMHAVRLTHLRHHRDCLGPDDVEGATARCGPARALLFGVSFPVRLHAAGFRMANGRHTRWLVVELALTVVILVAAIASPVAAFRYHVLAMAIGQTLTGFFAVWTVHHDCDRWVHIARTLRHRLKSAVAFNMFFHLEHHLYPRVPTCRLPILAERMDRAAPDLKHLSVY